MDISIFDLISKLNKDIRDLKLQTLTLENELKNEIEALKSETFSLSDELNNVKHEFKNFSTDK